MKYGFEVEDEDGDSDEVAQEDAEEDEVGISYIFISSYLHTLYIIFYIFFF